MFAEASPPAFISVLSLLIITTQSAPAYIHILLYIERVRVRIYKYIYIHIYIQRERDIFYWCIVAVDYYHTDYYHTQSVSLHPYTHSDILLVMCILVRH